MKAIKLDRKEKSITLIDIASITEAQDIVGGELIDINRLDNGDVIYTTEAQVRDIIVTAIIIGEDCNEEMCDVKSTITELEHGGALWGQ